MQVQTVLPFAASGIASHDDSVALQKAGILKPGKVRSVRTVGNEILGFCLVYWTIVYRLPNLYQKLWKANLERQ